MAVALVAVAALLAVLPVPATSWRASRVAAQVVRAPHTVLQGAGTLPRSPKDVATEVSVAVGVALREGRQRLWIVTPNDLVFGLFGKPMGKQVLGNPDVRAPTSLLLRCERELAYLMVEMFQDYAASCVVVFCDRTRVKAAEKDWKTAAVRPGRIVSGLSELKKPVGFGKGAAAAGAPKVVIVSRPSSADLAELAPFAEELGLDAVIVLLNPQGRPEGYFTAFTMLDNPHPNWAGGLLYQAHPGPWILGAAGNNGEVKVHGTSKRRPTLDEIDAGFDKVASDTNWFSGGGVAAALRRRGATVAAGESSSS